MSQASRTQPVKDLRDALTRRHHQLHYFCTTHPRYSYAQPIHPRNSACTLGLYLLQPENPSTPARHPYNPHCLVCRPAL